MDKKISAIRLARGYSQDFVAKKLGIEQAAYSKIEKDGKVKVDEALLIKISNALGVSVEDIKSPTPIIMNFHEIHDYQNSQFGKYSLQNNSLSEKLFENLVQQLKIKDKQIEDLIGKIK